jgi:hypothetical protein
MVITVAQQQLADWAGRDRSRCDDSLRRRLEIANRRIRELSVENQRLRRQRRVRPGPTPRRRQGTPAFHRMLLEEAQESL